LDVFGASIFAAKSPLPPVPKKVPVKKGGAKKKENDDAGDDEPALEEAGKKLDIGYLADLPSSTFNLEAWKTKYANTSPSRPEATDWFWQNFDHQGWSLHIFQYNFPDECTKDFITANKFGGFLQRAEAVKNLARYSMVSQVTLKKDQYFLIYGVWLFRGETVPPEFKDVDDYNYYTWTKVDVNNHDHKSFVTDLWAWDTQNDWGGRGEYINARTWGC